MQFKNVNCIHESQNFQNNKNFRNATNNAKKITKALFTDTEQTVIKLIKDMLYPKDQSLGYRLYESDVEDKSQWLGKFMEVMQLEYQQEKWKQGNNTNKIQKHFWIIDDIIQPYTHYGSKETRSQLKMCEQLNNQVLLTDTHDNLKLSRVQSQKGTMRLVFFEKK